jgi:hypothetical protein
LRSVLVRDAPFAGACARQDIVGIANRLVWAALIATAGNSNKTLHIALHSSKLGMVKSSYGQTTQAMQSDCPASLLPHDADIPMEDTMSIRKATVVAMFATVMFGAGAALAEPQTALGTQVSEFQATHRSVLSGGVGREEHILADQNLAMAEQLVKQGKTAEAQVYLNTARGTMGLPVAGGASVGAVKAFTPDFYNPVR